MGLARTLDDRLPRRAQRALLHLGRRVSGLPRALAVEMAAERIAGRCRVIARARHPDPLTVLVFHAFRFPEDVEVLAAQGELTLIEVPVEVLMEINGLFRTMPRDVPGDSYNYHREQDPAVLAERAREARFHAEVLTALRARLDFDCALTPAVHYRSDFPWARVFEAAGIPFVAMHKELTVIDRRHIPERVEIYRDGAFRFEGSWSFVTSENAKTLFTEGGVFDPARIEVTGLPRMDRLFQASGAFGEKQHDGKQVTFFSFPHYCGGMGVSKERRSKLFSRHDDEGFVALFKAVHGAIAELAQRRPEVRVRIKPKHPAPWWIEEIEQVFRDTVGVGTDGLPNCEIVDEPAPALIRDADAVVAFNSTVLLESLALGRPTILPYFAEAEGELSHYVYLRDNLEAFSVVRSREALLKRVEAALADGLPEESDGAAARRHDCLTYYLGYDDGDNAGRIARGLRRVVERYRQREAGGPAPESRAA